MKCDELKVYVPQDGSYGLEPEEGGKLVEEETCYLKSDVDAAIAELKEENLNLKAKNIELQSFYDLHGNVDNYIDKLKGELKSRRQAAIDIKLSAEKVLRDLLDCGLIKEWYFNGKFNAVLKADDPHLQIAELKQKLDEKDEKIDELEESIGELQKATDSAWSKVNAMYDELRHHKYKRCLDKAEMCKARYDEEDARVNGRGASWDYTSEEMKYWERWHKRWLELAEKFKEAK